MNQGIIPPIILEHAAKNARTQAEREAARRTLILSEIAREQREQAAVEPNEGEQRRGHDAEAKTILPGILVRSEDQPPTSDQDVDEAYDGAGSTYAYYLTVHGRRSFDNQGATLISTTNYDRDFDNAFWNGRQMAYGRGRIFNSFTRDFSVIAHELTHAVTQYTANLVYRDEPGALNEHVSDAFAALAEQWVRGQTAADGSWLIGAKLMEGKVNGRALRDMRHPGTAYDDPVIGRDPQPDHMDRYNPTPQDNGGVHINSGIPNRAFAEACLARGGFAWETVGQIWYDTLTKRLTPTSNFGECAAATLRAADALFGPTSVEHEAVLHGWRTVGVDPAARPVPEPDPEEPSPCFDLIRDPELVDLLRQVARHPIVRRLFLGAQR